jgi:exopolyphosphatase/pppGpp-phosphohydrolase
VALLVIPQRVEGRYGYVAAERGLDGRLRTSHILDIGGGSLQVAGRAGAWGRPLGQKAWNKLLCDEIRSGADCALPAMSGDELERARRLIGVQLGDLPGTLSGPVTLTAISRPVSRGLFPALKRLVADGDLAADSMDGGGFSLAAVEAALARLAPLQLEERSALSGVTPPFSAYLVSDLILVEGILKATGATRLEVAELDITNVPGLLADDRAFAWARRYGCYLDRLRRQGEAAYDANPAACPRVTGPRHH